MNVLLITCETDSAALSALLPTLQTTKKLNLKVENSADHAYSGEFDIVITHGHKKHWQFQSRYSQLNSVWGIFDPKPEDLEITKLCDFLIVGSSEQKQFFMGYNKQIYVWFMIPEFKSRLVKHYDGGEKINLIYHGNKIHLNCALPSMIAAIQALSERYDLKLTLITNKKMLGSWKGLKDKPGFEIIEKNWYPNCYNDYFTDNSIGLVPFYIPPMKPSGFSSMLRTKIRRRMFLESKHDYVFQIKPSTNPGRIFVFARFGIPVVTEAVLSSSELIDDGISGKLVLNGEGWYLALEELLLSNTLRSRLGKALLLKTEHYFDGKERELSLVQFLNGVSRRAKPVAHVNLQKNNIKRLVCSEIVNFFKRRIMKL